MRYEDQVKKVCGDNWRSVSQEEREGGYAVAIMMAFIKGVKPNVPDLAYHLDVQPFELSNPVNRMTRLGIFKKWDIQKDYSLRGELGDEEASRAWAHIAGCGAGFVGNLNF